MTPRLRTKNIMEVLCCALIQNQMKAQMMNSFSWYYQHLFNEDNNSHLKPKTSKNYRVNTCRTYQLSVIITVPVLTADKSNNNSAQIIIVTQICKVLACHLRQFRFNNYSSSSINKIFSFANYLAKKFRTRANMCLMSLTVTTSSVFTFSDA